MKKYLIIVLSTLTLSAVAASAQGFGVTAGMNFNSTKVKDVQLDSKVGWNVGVTYALDLPLGFSVQPSLVYTHKNADVVLGTQSVGSINLPVSAQWGPDLLVARPFLDVTPYIGYTVSNKVKGDLIDENGKNAFEYGVGVGAGLEVWKLQLIVRYNWNFGALGSLNDFAGLDRDAFTDQTYGGVSVHLAFFF